MAQIIGRIVHKLSTFDLHIKYQEQILTFYKAMIEHRDEQTVMTGICNLPCFNLLYKDRLGRPPPGTAETQSTSATHTVNQDNGDDDEEERKVIDIDF